MFILQLKIGLTHADPRFLGLFLVRVIHKKKISTDNHELLVDFVISSMFATYALFKLHDDRGISSSVIGNNKSCFFVFCSISRHMFLSYNRQPKSKFKATRCYKIGCTLFDRQRHKYTNGTIPFRTTLQLPGQFAIVRIVILQCVF